MIVVRYLVFAVVGVVVAAALFFVLNLAISATEDTSTSMIQRWLTRVTCERYELSGTVRDVEGAPIPFAVVEALYLDQRLSTRSRGDGRFTIAGNQKTCEEQPEVVSVFVSADDFRSKRRVLRYEEPTLDIVLDRADF
jgi:hypothetical protein